MSMRNHTYCQSRKNEYKKSGHKRPDLRTVCFVLFCFLVMPELKDKPVWLETLPL